MNCVFNFLLNKNIATKREKEVSLDVTFPGCWIRVGSQTLLNPKPKKSCQNSKKNLLLDLFDHN